MAEIVLFHSAHGLRGDVHAWAESLRAAGHQLHTPDLFEGATFERLEDGIAHRDRLGIPVLMRRAADALDELSAQLVYAGFSMGAATAEYYAATRDGARGALLMHSIAPLKTFGVNVWPNPVAIQLHYTVGDPLVGDRRDVDALRALATRAAAPIEVYKYPGSGHLFADPRRPRLRPRSRAADA